MVCCTICLSISYFTIFLFLLGIWADSDDEMKESVDNVKKKKDYSAPIAFVSGGLKEENKTKKEDSTKKKKGEPSFRPAGFSGASNLGLIFNWFDYFFTIFVFLGSGDQQIGQWEMYTKGVGSKLLQKMGYQPGKGLGKQLQGITAPIEAKKRPGFGAIGLYGPEITKKPQPISRDDDEIIDLKHDPVDKDWKKDNDPNRIKSKKVKIYTKSTEDIIAESVKKSWNNSDANEYSKMKIIDMTGPEQRVLAGISHLHQSKPEKPKEDYEITPYNTRFDIPELKLNIERLVKLSENHLIKCDKDFYRDQNQIEHLVDEKKRLTQIVLEETEQLERLEEFTNLVVNLQLNIDRFNVDSALKKFENYITDDIRKYLRTLGLDNLILCTFTPLLRKELKFWNVFNEESSSKYFELFKRLKSIVTKNKTFDILLWENWFPTTSRALQQWPTMKQYDSIITFVELWRTILPKWLYEYFISNCLLKKMLNDVELWNPLTDVLPIHSWIHPWLPILLVDHTSDSDSEERNFLFEPIYDVIRKKLSKALTNWHPNDASARLILEPWKGVFSEPSFQTFLDINIVPKLERAMQSYVINPNQQSMEEWNWVLSWKKLLSLNTLALILERYFFPNWLSVLYSWLNSGMANFNEISSWYQGWKSLIGDDFVNHSGIKEFLKKALMMMDHAVNLSGGMKTFISYYNPNAASVQEPTVEPSYNIPPPPPIPLPPTFDKLSFRQMVEMKAQENGALFMPIANRFQDGHQVFQFGQYFVYIDNQVLFQQKFVNGNRLWVPVRLQELIDMTLPL